MRRIVTTLLAMVLLAFTGATTAAAAPAAPPKDDVSIQAVWECNPRTSYRYCTSTNARVNVRTQPWTNSGIVTTVPAGTNVSVSCYRWGESINGDSVWYWVSVDDINHSPISWPKGYIAGYYLNTGADPNPLFPWCGA